MPPRSEPNAFLRGLLLGYALVWLAAAIAPRDWGVWALENLPVGIAVFVLAATWRRFAFSNLSYLLLAIFLALHAIGAHTGYSHMPLGNWLRDALGLRRNYYDRFVHCAFGFLLAYPVRELLLRTAGLSRRAASWYAIALIAAASTAFEVAEALLAGVLAPGAGPAWLGAQGDEWDSQLDMLVALLGAIAAMIVTWRHERAPVPVGAAR